MNNSEYPDVDRELIFDETTNITKSSNSKQIIIFFSFKLLTIVLFLLGLCKMPPEIPITFILISGMVEFWFTKNVSGLQLVGMRWSHEIGDNGEPHLFFYVRPDPYVSEQQDSNAFYFGLVSASLVWFVFFTLSILFFKAISLAISLIIFSLEIFNLICFFKCSQISIQQADDIARDIILHDSNPSQNDISVPLSSETDHLEINVQD